MVFFCSAECTTVCLAKGVPRDLCGVLSSASLSVQSTSPSPRAGTSCRRERAAPLHGISSQGYAGQQNDSTLRSRRCTNHRFLRAMLAIVAEVTGLVSGFGASRRFFRLQLGIMRNLGAGRPTPYRDAAHQGGQWTYLNLQRDLR